MNSIESIKKHLSDRAHTLHIEVHDSTGSTNDLAKEYAKSEAGAESVFIAKKQTAGRGRRGRSFFSPDGTGLYMSLLLRPAYSPELSSLLTTAAAAATAKAIEELSGRKADIKWINDIFIDGKKACGILCESALTADGTGLDYAIVGIGINLCDPEGGFPEEIRNIATSVFGFERPNEETFCKLSAKIINNLLEYYDALSDRSYFEEYKKRLFVLGKEVTVITPAESYVALAVDIDGDAHLLVKLPDGSERKLSSGEISIKT